MHDLYTGIFAVTLSSIFMRKSQPIRRAMVIAIALLFVTTTINFGLNWYRMYIVFIKHGQTFWSKYLASQNPGSIVLGMGFTTSICTILADSIMIWRCRMVWGRRWAIILLPILLLISGLVFRIIHVYQEYAIGHGYQLGAVLYISFTLVATLWCTVQIVYRILTVANNGTGKGFRAYRHVIEVLVESSALYSIALVIYVCFYARK
ncbi:uncharacterized protein EV420DRAFT_617873 [Desarmillaria tabescens]|uniref:Uncharacterized protein n=1 Tax=Armillaria tabescens TaxID=1929756 RepID=A0AA39N0V1_ARMTA|nr:uncharacterized protein EV420DRAFT_617873 [Desarmillaria tabescens]KAK0454066.1 hypothetical protein EV420DRAFT_617873 [Desarmillaria tabescens]